MRLRNPQWFKLRRSCFAFFLLPSPQCPPRPMQSRREDRQFGWSQTSPMPQGTTCSSVETEQTRYSSRRVSGPPQFLMMLICNWDQIFEPCSEQILFHSCPPSRAERGLPHPNLNIYHVRYVDSNMQAENRRQFPTTNCTSHHKNNLVLHWVLT